MPLKWRLVLRSKDDFLSYPDDWRVEMGCLGNQNGSSNQKIDDLYDVINVIIEFRMILSMGRSKQPRKGGTSNHENTNNSILWGENVGAVGGLGQCVGSE